MCYGLKGAVPTFCRLMHKIFNHIPSHHLALYMDDLCVISKTSSEHLENLQETFDALRKHGLRIKAVKCSFAMSEVTFLGHKITRNGLSPLHSKVEAVQKWPPPANVRDLQRFLGPVGWYRRFIKNFSDISFPLYQMLQKGANFIWSDDAHQAFEQLKLKLTEAPVLIHPDPKKNFKVETDPSKVAIGGVVLQEKEPNQWHPIAYYNRALSKRERGYPPYEREALAIRDTLVHFRYYLLANRFLLKTDHQALLKIQEVKDPFGRRATMLRDICEFDFTIMFVRGVDNKMADALTRLGYEFSPTVQHFETELEKPGSHEINAYLLGSADINSVSLDNREDILTSLAKNPNYFVECQQMDSSLASIVTELQKNPDHYNKKVAHNITKNILN